MRGRIIVAALAVSLTLLAIPQSAFAGKPSRGCPPGFDLGEQTLSQALVLPNTLAGLGAGAYTEAEFTALFAFLNKNGDDKICFQSFPANAGESSALQYYYNKVDNNSSVPSG